MRKQIREYAKKIRPEVTEWFHYLHTHPELGFCEENTAAFAENILKTHTDMEIRRIGKIGIAAVMRTGAPGPVLAFRADMDALPIQENPDHSPCSVNPGVMHACGHDGHTATLLGAAVILNQMRDELGGEIRLIFQPAEEVQPGGAKMIEESNILEGVDRIFGLHYSIDEEVGFFSVRPGANFAANYKFDIRLTGKEGHAAFPHLAQDMILAGAELTCMLNRIVSRKIDPMSSALLSVTQIHGGTTYNSLPEEIHIGGTLRFHDEKCRDILIENMENTVKCIGEMYEADTEIAVEEGCGPLCNEAGTEKAVEEILSRHFGREHILDHPPVMGCEDFSEYLKKRKGCYFRVGARYTEEDGTVYPTHNSGFRLNEEALVYGVESIVSILTEMPQYLKKAKRKE
ncbi:MULTISPECIES: amidohydrolase [Eubacteriales]|uniref:M20 metallopeptidase family protein n=1 Tax=Eubacteriales TaxID=186802 RepID=UPI0014865DA6|nr:MULTISPECIES: amidohydrolase [Eubacteriales]